MLDSDGASRPRPASFGQDDIGGGDDATLSLLTGPDVADVLDAAVATAGGRLVRWRAEQVDHRPGRTTTVSYAADVAWADCVRGETLGASVGFPTDGERPGVLVLSDGAVEVAVWLLPLDPGLPALASATSPDGIRALLGEVGLRLGPTEPITLRRRAYRPRRRAVVEVRSSSGRVFLKVVPPARVVDLDRRHRLLREAGVPVPQALGWREDGLLVLQALSGRPLRDGLRADGAAASDPRDLRRILDSLPEALLALPRRMSWTDGAGHYAQVIGSALPGEAGRAGELARAVQDGLRAIEEPVVAVHGDFYEAQILTGAGRVTGVLDVDSAGPGHRADDVGCLVAHAEVLAQIYPEDAPRFREAVGAWLGEFDVDPLTSPSANRLRTAGVLLSLATGPHRVQEEGWAETTSRRLDLVEEWLAQADGGRGSLARGV